MHFLWLRGSTELPPSWYILLPCSVRLYRLKYSHVNLFKFLNFPPFEHNSSLILPFCLFFRPSFRPFVRRSFRPSFRPSFFLYFISSVLSSFRLILFAKHKTHSFFQSFIHRCQHFCFFQDGGKQKPSYTFRLQRVDLLILGAWRACRGWKVQGR